MDDDLFLAIGDANVIIAGRITRTEPHHMTYTNSDCEWDDEATGRMVYDDFFDTEVPEVDYVPAGSVPLTTWETMLFTDAGVVWGRDPSMLLVVDAYDLDLDEEDDEGDWQVLALDRFGDRVTVGYANSRY